MTIASYTVKAGFITVGSLDVVPASDVERIRIQRNIASLFDQIQVGRCDVVLNNLYRQYSPGNDASPYTLLPNQEIQVEATHSGSTYVLFRGFIDSFTVDPAVRQRRATVRASDRAKFLRREINVPMTIGVSPNSLSTDVLSAAGITSAQRDVSIVTGDVIPFVKGLDATTAGKALDDILKSGGHFMYVRGDGDLVMRDRNSPLLEASPVASYVADSGVNPGGFSACKYLRDSAALPNDIRIESEPRKEATSQHTLAFLQDAIALPNSDLAFDGTVTFFLEYTDPDTQERQVPAVNIVTPVESTDWRVTTEEGGGGTDLSSGMTLAFTAFAQSAKAVFTNPGTFFGHISKFNVRGTALSRQPKITAVAESSSSQSAFEKTSFKLQNDLIGGQFEAQAYADFILDRRAEPQPAVSFGLKNLFPDVLARELLDPITVVESDTGVQSVFMIVGIEHNITMARGTEHTLQCVIERLPTKSFLVLDKDPEGKLDIRKLAF